MNEFDFEELLADMLGIRDEQREDNSFLEQQFYDVFGIEFEQGFGLAKRLLEHTVPVKAGLSGKSYHAFVSKTGPFMLMKIEAKNAAKAI